MLFLSHMNQIPLIYQRTRLAQLVDALSLKHWDLGSIPRSPIFFNEFCFHLISCSVRPGVHHTPTIQACHMANNLNPLAMIWGAPYALVNEATRDYQKSNRPPMIGPNCWPNTSKLGSTPPKCLYFFSFSEFFLLFV